MNTSDIVWVVLDSLVWGACAVMLVWGRRRRNRRGPVESALGRACMVCGSKNWTLDVVYVPSEERVTGVQLYTNYRWQVTCSKGHEIHAQASVFGAELGSLL